MSVVEQFRTANPKIVFAPTVQLATSHGRLFGVACIDGKPALRNGKRIRIWNHYLVRSLVRFATTTQAEDKAAIEVEAMLEDVAELYDAVIV